MQSFTLLISTFILNIIYVYKSSHKNFMLCMVKWDILVLRGAEFMSSLFGVKNYQNQSRFAKVTTKSLLPRATFFMDQSIYLCSHVPSRLQHITVTACEDQDRETEQICIAQDRCSVLYNRILVTWDCLKYGNIPALCGSCVWQRSLLLIYESVIFNVFDI